MNSQRVRDFMSQNFCENKIAKKTYASIVAYPQNDVKELAKIMMDIRIDCLPVFSSPWNKKLIGILEFKKIKAFLKD